MGGFERWERKNVTKSERPLLSQNDAGLSELVVLNAQQGVGGEHAAAFVVSAAGRCLHNGAND